MKPDIFWKDVPKELIHHKKKKQLSSSGEKKKKILEMRMSHGFGNFAFLIVVMPHSFQKEKVTYTEKSIILPFFFLTSHILLWKLDITRNSLLEGQLSFLPHDEDSWTKFSVSLEALIWMQWEGMKHIARVMRNSILWYLKKKRGFE